MAVTPQREFWQGKRVVLTGHTGFKGAWMTVWLKNLGAKVTGISLEPNTKPSLFSLVKIEELCDSHICDIRNLELLSDLIQEAQPEIIFHLAAQPLVRASYRDPLETYSTNVMGTAHVLDAIKNRCDTRVAVMVTTDKVYQNHEWIWPYRETDALGGHDPYSASKAACEIVISSYRDAFLREQGTAVASARAGNVIGGGDWSEDRLIPDAMRAWSASRVLEIRRPEAIRPWQHVLEPLCGYLTLAQALWERPSLAGAYNFGPDPNETATVRSVIDLARASYKGDVDYGNGSEGPHEAGWLALETAKSRTMLNYIPQWGLTESVRRTIAWYRAQQEGRDARKLCEMDIAAYMDEAES